MNTAKDLLSIRRLSPLARQEALWGLLFLSPWILGFLAFTLIPMIATLGFTFSNFTLTQETPLSFVGFNNYTHLFQDTQTWASLGVTLKYALIALPIGLVVPLALAILMNSKHLRAPAIFRTLFYMPYIIPFVASLFAWQEMLNPETGWINTSLRALGVANPPYWTNDTTWIYPALVIMGIWGIGSAMVINLASLQGIPTELYDAANVDGAGWWATLFNVTLPLISPVIFYSLTLGIVEIFQYFLVPLVLNNGSGAPGGTTLFYNLYLYKTFFTYQDMAYGSTLAWLLFVIILAVTGLLFLSSRYWVYYAGENNN
jgi:multiple sugar transport system permease protein